MSLASFAVLLVISTFAVAPSHAAVPPCKQPAKPVSCSCDKITYYYDCETETCMPYACGKCASNENSFDCKDDCEKQCFPPPVEYCPKDNCCYKSKKHDECCDDDCCDDDKICCQTRCGNKCQTPVPKKVKGAGKHLLECDPECEYNKK